MVLHTFGRDDKWNSHIHALMAELGVSDNNCKKIDFILFDMLRKHFQKVILDLLEIEIGKDENIPTEVVEMLDEADCIGVDLSEPPKFNCEKCPGKMVPIYYKSVHGRTYEYKEK